MTTTATERAAIRHERDHEFIAEIRTVLRFLVAVMGVNFAGVVYLVWHGLHP